MDESDFRFAATAVVADVEVEDDGDG